MHSFPSFNKKGFILLRTHNQHGTDYTASAERTISTVALLYFPPYDTNRSIRSRLPFIYTHQDPLYICRNLTQSIRSCYQHPCILTCHFHSPILSADRTITTLYSPTLTWHYPQQPEAFNNPTLYSLSAEKSFHPILTCHLTSGLRPATAILLRILILYRKIDEETTSFLLFLLLSVFYYWGFGCGRIRDTWNRWRIFLWQRNTKKPSGIQSFC